MKKLPEAIHHVSDIEKKYAVKFDKVIIMLKEAFEQLKPIKDKDSVIVIGQTGAGKSTTINYLMGSKLGNIEVEQKNEKTGKVLKKKMLAVLPGETEYAKTGIKAFNSETLYSQGTVVGPDGFSYVDTPGFEDTRKGEEGLIAALGPVLALRFVSKIRAIMLAIDYGSFNANRGESLKNSIRTLAEFIKEVPLQNIGPSAAHLLKDILSHPATVLDSLTATFGRLIFSVTKVPDDVDVDQVISLFEELSQTFENDMASPQISSEEKENLQLAISVLEYAIKNPSNIFLLNKNQITYDPSQPQKSTVLREQITHKLKSFKPVDKSDFKLSHANSTINKLNEILFDIISTGNQVISDIDLLPAQIAADKASKVSYEQKIKDYEDSAKNPVLVNSSTDKHEKKDHFNKSIETDQNKIVDNNIQLAGLKFKSELLEKEIDDLNDPQKTELIWSESAPNLGIGWWLLGKTGSVASKIIDGPLSLLLKLIPGSNAETNSDKTTENSAEIKGLVEGAAARIATVSKTFTYNQKDGQNQPIPYPSTIPGKNDQQNPVKTNKSGNFSEEIKEPLNGKYSVKYTGEPFKNGEASVELFCVKCEHPVYKAKIAKLNEQLKELKMQIAALESDNATLAKGIELAHSTDATKIAVLNDEHKKRVAELSISIHANELRLAAAQQSFPQYQPLVEMVTKLNEVTPIKGVTPEEISTFSTRFAQPKVVAHSLVGTPVNFFPPAATGSLPANSPSLGMKGL